ncbi:MAG: hypothetical protein H7318_17065 [Oligoflexus sp.]|nr:hypothetical protein [Oligoflexus sp.]
MSARKSTVIPARALAWDEILTLLQDGRMKIETLTKEEALILDASLRPMIKSGDWARISYLIERFHRSPSQTAQLLSLNLQSQLAFEQSDYISVEKLCLQILAIESDNESAKLALGLIYLYGGQFAKAIPYLNDTKPNPKALAGLVSAHRHLQNNDLADAICEKYQTEKSELWEISYNCSLFEAQNMQSPDKALKILRASLDNQPGDSDASRELRKAITQIEVARLQKDRAEETM